MSAPVHSARRGGAALAAGALLGLGALLLYANAAGRSGHEILPWAVRLLEGGVDWAAAGRAAVSVRVPVALALLAFLAWRSARRETADAGWIAATLGLACVAQSFLLQGSLAAGIALYALAAAAWLAQPGPRGPLDRALPARLERASFVGLFVLATVASVARLDVVPPLEFDEFAYALAAREALGELGPDADLPFLLFSAYEFDRFVAQPAPLALHVSAARLLDPGILAQRLASVAAGLIGLLVGVLAVRRHLGPRLALGTLAAAGFAPLLLTSGRYAHFISASLLHAALVVTLVLRLVERRDRVSAALLGLALGGSLYFYQLSWFAPILAGAGLAAAGLLAPRRESRRLALPLLAAALLALLPGALFLQKGLRLVAGDTFDPRATWIDAPAIAGPTRSLLVRLPYAMPSEALRTRVSELRGRDVAALPMASTDGHRALALTGTPQQLHEALADLGLDHRQILAESPAPGAVASLAGMLATLVYKPALEFGTRIVDAPVLAPLVPPLALLGLLEAVRRRRHPALRVLLAWVPLAALLPAALGGVAPRRAVLALPFLQMFAVLPALRLLDAFAPARRRFAAPALALALLFVVAGSGSFLYFERRGRELRPWKDADPARAVADTDPWHGGVLEVVNVLEGLPRDEPARILGVDFPLAPYLRLIEREPPPGSPPRYRIEPWTLGSEQILRRSCRTGGPFAWIAPSTEAFRARLALLEQSFRVRRETRGAYDVWHLEGLRPGACAGRALRQKSSSSDPAAQSSSPGAVRPLPPLTTEYRPKAVLERPPTTVLKLLNVELLRPPTATVSAFCERFPRPPTTTALPPPAASLWLPPSTAVVLPLATLFEPPHTAEFPPLTVFEMPPVTEPPVPRETFRAPPVAVAPWLVTALPVPATRPE